MLKIRLMRIGAKKRPFYRVVVVDERAKRTGAYSELLGTYNPLTEPHEVKLKQDRIDYWIKQGAQPSDGFLRIIGKAKQRPARKPKKTTGERQQGTEEKDKKTEETPVESASEEKAAEQTQQIETPAEEPKTEEVKEEQSAQEEKPAEETEKEA